MQLERLSHVLLYVTSIEESRRFYTEILGFEVLEEDPDHGGTFMSIAGGGHSLDLVPIPAERPVLPKTAEEVAAYKLRPGMGHLAFHIASEDALRDAYFELIDAGVQVFNAVDHKSQLSVYFFDPDNNVLEICWERPGARAMYASGREDEDTQLVFERPAKQS